MTEPTAEQVRAEVERAHALTDAEDLCDWPSEDYHSSPCRAIATALARVRIEAHAAGRDDELEAAAHLSETFDELVHMHDLPDAIRALRVRT